MDGGFPDYSHTPRTLQNAASFSDREISGIENSRSDSYSRLVDMIQGKRISSYFQPIIDMFGADIFGYELLARGEGEFFSPIDMFSHAEKWQLSWELEYACRYAAIKRINEEIDKLPHASFFINVSPKVFSSSHFQKSFTMDTLKTYGIDSKQLVLEITETASVNDYTLFEETIRHYVEQGFRIALDDFGSGHSGLVTLVATTPHIMKVDKQIVSGIHRSSYKQNLVRAISEFADTVGSSILVEGIESEDELRTAYRLGARYAQGYFFGRPDPEPRKLENQVANTLRGLRDEYMRHSYSVDISIHRLITRPPTFIEGTHHADDLDEFFQSHNSVSFVVIVDKEDTPKGIITRNYFYNLLSGRYGYVIFQRKTVEKLAKSNMLLIREDTDLRVLGRLAMARQEEDIYDPVVVSREDGRLVGTISMKKVIHKAFDTEVRYATSANPLTGLPGNQVIGVWLEDLLLKAEYSIVYFDLDRFKEFNDYYGFSRGDEIIKMLAELLSERIQTCEAVYRIGHIGGDDFILLSEDIVSTDFLEGICQEFDERRKEFFCESDLGRGYFITENRRGEEVQVVLTTLSAAVVTSENFRRPPHPGKLGEEVAHLKSKVKKLNIESGKSGYLFERRVYG
ncbi:MAG: EAL domain-containing protein [Spirochaetaceae bacterium]